MRIVAVDTAGPVVGVALYVDGDVTARTVRVRRGAEALLVPWAVELANSAGIELSAIDAVAVAVGPGAFTGVRVGIATAVGLALAADCPVWEGCSLTHRAAVVSDDLVLSMLDARKSRVYAALYESGTLVRAPADVPPETAVSWVSGAFSATGPGAVCYAEQVQAAGGVVVEDAEEPAVHMLALQASAGLARGEGVSAEQVRPVYLRDADAKPPRNLLR